MVTEMNVNVLLTAYDEIAEAQRKINTLSEEAKKMAGVCEVDAQGVHLTFDALVETLSPLDYQYGVTKTFLEVGQKSLLFGTYVDGVMFYCIVSSLTELVNKINALPLDLQESILL